MPQTDYITLEEVKSTLTLTGQTYADADITRAITAASRGIDMMCNRRFYLDDDGPDALYYDPPAAGDELDIDDHATVSLVETDNDGSGAFATSWTFGVDYVLRPTQATAWGMPFTKIVRKTTSPLVFPNASYLESVRVTGTFGWPAVPEAVVQATSIIATKLVKRAREAPFAIVGVGVDNFAVRLGKSDPEVAFLLGPYRRHRVAVA